MSTADPSTPAKAVRLYHLADEWEIPPARLVELLRFGGLEVESHFTEFPSDAIEELKAKLARGRDAEESAKANAKAKAEDEAKAEAKANAKAKAEDEAKAEAKANAKTKAEAEARAEAEAKAVSLPKKKRKRRTKRKSEATKRPTRSLYGSGRLIPIEPPTAAKPRDDAGVAPATPSFGKREATPPRPAPAAPSAPAAPVDEAERARQESSRRWSVPAFGNGTAPRPPTPQSGTAPIAEPVASASPAEDTPSSSGLPLVVALLVAIAVGALLFWFSDIWT